MKLINLKFVLLAAVVTAPVVWAGLVLAEDRPSGRESVGHPLEGATVVAASPDAHDRSNAHTRPFPGHRRPARFAPTPEEPVDTVDPDASPSGSFEEELAAGLQAGHDNERRFVEAFESQSVDRHWAQEREAALTSDIDRELSELGGFRHSDVECRSNKCLATVTWEDYGSATATVGTAADLTKGECATWVFMPPPEDSSASYTHKIRLGDCVADTDL